MEKRKVFYKNIIIEGFQSISYPLVFEFDRVGINLIRGTNGLGKSTIFNALLWVEYGINLKKSVATWEDRRPEKFRGVRVVVERTDGEFDYMIARHLGFKGTTKGLAAGDKLMIFKKTVAEPEFTQAHLQGEGLHKSDMQALIEKQLGIDSSTYLNSILFGQRMKSLAEVDNKEKRGLFDKLFDVDFVEDAKLKGKEKKATAEKDAALLEAKLLNENNKIENNTKFVDENKKLAETFEEKKTARLVELRGIHQSWIDYQATLPEKLATAEQELAKFDFKKLEDARALTQLQKDKLTVAQQELADLKRNITEQGKEIEKAKNNIVKYQQELDDLVDTCPTCKAKFKKEHLATVKAGINDKIKKENEVISTMENTLKTETEKLLPKEATITTELAEYNRLQGEAEKIAEGLKSADVYKNTIASTKTEMTNATDNLATAQQAIDREQETKLEIDFEKYETEIRLSRALVVDLTAQVEKLYKRIALLDWWVSKGFGAGGLKSFVFNAMLSGLNQYAQKYAQRLGFRVEFSVDMTKALKPFQMLVYDGDKVRDYDDLSGGQKQRVDVCIAFAMHDLVSFKTDINIVLLDEVFEGLDNAGVEAAFDLIRQKAETKSVYVITHYDVIDGLNCKTITVSSGAEKQTIVE